MDATYRYRYLEEDRRDDVCSRFLCGSRGASEAGSLSNVNMYEYSNPRMHAARVVF